jgi:hypothetical protein
MQARRESLDHKPYESLYLHTETIIDHPVQKVWPHALNIGGWMSAHRLETVAGEPGKVGHFERVFPRDLTDDVPLPRYHLYGIAEIIPFKLIALEVLPEEGGSYGITRQWMSFDSILLTDMGARTNLTFLMVDAHMGKGDETFHARRRSELETARGLLDKYFENLKRLIGDHA